MSRLIIFCKNGVETLSYFSAQMAQAFASRDYEIFWLDLNMTGRGAWKLRQMVPGKEAVLVTFNCIGLSGEEGLWELDDAGMACSSIWEQLGIRCLNILADHPMYYYKPLRHPVPGMRVYCIDRDHAAYMKRFYPQIPCGFLPLAGNCLPGEALVPGQAESLEQWIKRPYPVVFTANYVPLANIEKQLRSLEPEYRDFYFEIIHALVRHPGQDLFSCIETYLRREMPDITDEGICSAMSTMPAVDLWVRTHFREKTVRALAEGGITVHVFGKDWEQMPCSHPQHIISCGRMIDSAGCARAMAQGKIALNTMPWFKDGAHDRIFTAMLQQAVPLTDASTYLQENFRDMDPVVYYDLEKLEELPQKAGQLLQEPEQMHALASRGKSLAQQHHLWACRADMLEADF